MDGIVKIQVVFRVLHLEHVSLIKAFSYQDGLTEKLVELLEPLGGLTSFGKRGERVILKPNLVMAWSVEKAANTHPAVILAVASLLLDLGCKVALGDSPGLGSAEGVIRKLGIADSLTKMGIPVVEFNRECAVLKRSLADNTNGHRRRFKNLRLAAELNEYDRIINLAKLKSHGQMGITLATKNLFGCVVGTAKSQWHFAAGNDASIFARLLVEVALAVNADLHIVDGIIGMDDNGPSNGRPRPLNLLAAGSNPLAVDRVIVDVVGKRPEDFPIFTAARDIGVAGTDIHDIYCHGDTVNHCRIPDFQIPPMAHVEFRFGKPVINGLLKKILYSKIRIDRSACVHCQKCEKQCPAGAIKYRNGIVINHSRCIKCCCCQEICPAGALTVEHSPGIKILKKLGIV